MVVRTKKVIVAAGFCHFPNLSDYEVQKVWEREKRSRVYVFVLVLERLFGRPSYRQKDEHIEMQRKQIQ